MSPAQGVALSISDKGFDSKDTVLGNLQRMQKHGFTHLHFSSGWTGAQPLNTEMMNEWAQHLTDARIKVLDVHGPHPDDVHLWVDDPDARALAIKRIRKRLNLTKQLGGDAIVYHVPTHCECHPAMIKRFIDGLARLEEETRQLGLKIALENHFLKENDRIALSAAFSRFDADYLGFTLDTGHGLRSGNLPWLLEHCMDRLTVLHLNDTEPGHDRHWIPNTVGGHVPWDEVAEAIAHSPYDKPLQFEISWHRNEQPSHDAFLAQLHREAVRFHDKVASYREKRNATA